jgi:hypothetical protein
MGLERETNRWYEVGGVIVAQNSTERKNIGNDPVMVGLLKHETNELSNAFKDRLHLVGSQSGRLCCYQILYYEP